MRLVLVGGRLGDGTLADVSLDPASGTILEVGRVDLAESDVVEDVSGMVILPAGVEAHAHLDKAFFWTGTIAPDLDTGVSEWKGRLGEISHQSFVDRATACVERLVAHGTTTIRSHVDVTTIHGLRGVHALIEVRDQMTRRGIADLELVALAGPLGGADSGAIRRLLDEAIEAGVDVVGASPDIDPDPIGATTAAVDAAVRAGRPLDLHTDQTVDPGLFYLPELIRQVRRHDLPGVVASHCVSLATQDIDTQKRTADALAEAGIAVFTMPLTSLYLFGWEQQVGPPRGVTAINVLRDAGVVVAAGSDNVQDTFFPFGRCDPFETANVLALVAHLDPADAWDMCSTAPRIAMGRPPVEVTPGSRADLVAIEGANIISALADASPNRIVVHRGSVVSRTRASAHLLA
ncbi:MAG: amidohydrolase family protein [Acidimicrobiales bacterium]